jgi:DNA replication protein DnaC
MNELTLLKPKLVRLKLSGILENLDSRLSQAAKEKWSFSNFLDILLSDEVERRNFKQLARRLAKSNLSPEKTLETFDFSFAAKLHEPTVREFANCHFLEQNENIFFLGPSGVGKSHLAQALGHQACRKGFDTYCDRTDLILKWIAAGKGDGSYEKRLKWIATIGLLILDDYGLKNLTEDQQADLFEIVTMRYETRATIITSNRDLSEWPSVFKNALMGSAVMDRLIHRANQIVIEGKSYRLNAFVKRRTKKD